MIRTCLILKEEGKQLVKLKEYTQLDFVSGFQIVYIVFFFLFKQNFILKNIVLCLRENNIQLIFMIYGDYFYSHQEH